MLKDNFFENISGFLNQAKNEFSEIFSENAEIHAKLMESINRLQELQSNIEDWQQALQKSIHDELKKQVRQEIFNYYHELRPFSARFAPLWELYHKEINEEEKEKILAMIQLTSEDFCNYVNNKLRILIEVLIEETAIEINNTLDVKKNDN